MLIGCSIPKNSFAETQEEKPVPTLYNEGENSLEEPIKGPPLDIPKDESTLPSPKKPTEPKPPSAGISQFSLFMDEDQPILNEPITGPAPGDGEEIVSEPAIGAEPIEELSIGQQAIELPPRAAVPTLTSYTYPGTKRGWLDIEWSPVTRASSYIVLIFNGRNYSEFPVSTTNGNVGKQRFTTYEKGIWPTPGSIASGGYQLYADGRGGDLQSDPRPVYTNGYNAGPQYGDYRQDFRYYVRIIAKNSTGRGEASDASTALIKDDTIVKPGKVSKPYVITKNQTGKETGEVELYWDAVPGATGYKVCMFNGKNYSEIPIGNFTFWTSKGKGIWPTKTEIEAGRYQLHTDGKGTELPIDPRPVYTNGYQAGGDFGDYRTWTNLFIYVKAVNSAGDGPGSEGVTSSIPLETPKIIDTEINSLDEKKGFAGLEWSEVPGAQGYYVWIFNGSDYQRFDVEDRTYWSTLGEGIFPTEEELNQGKNTFHTDGLGEEFNNRPWKLYSNGFKNGSLYGNYSSYDNYWFKVSAYVGGKNSSDSNGFTPTIPIGHENIPSPIDMDGLNNGETNKNDYTEPLPPLEPDNPGYIDDQTTPILELAGSVDDGPRSIQLRTEMLKLTGNSYSKKIKTTDGYYGWKLYHAYEKSSTSFYVQLYRKSVGKNKYNYAFAFKGSKEIVGDFVVQDALQVANNVGWLQANNAEAFVKKYLKQDKNLIANVYFTGHSLGGYLAAWIESDIVDASTGDSATKNNVKFSNINNTFAVTFNAPGLSLNLIPTVLDLFNDYKSKVNYKLGRERDYEYDGNIESLRIKGDPVSGIIGFDLLGKVRVYEPKDQTKANYQRHGISNFKDIKLY